MKALKKLGLLLSLGAWMGCAIAIMVIASVNIYEYWLVQHSITEIAFGFILAVMSAGCLIALGYFTLSLIYLTFTSSIPDRIKKFLNEED